MKIAISDPEPAAVRGLKKIVVTGTYQQTTVDEVFYVSDDGRKILRGFIYDIAQSPFEEQLKKLKTDLSPSLGTPGAKVILVVFTDFQCPHCREFAKTLRENLVKTYPTEVRLYIKEFPIESIHPWAKAAAIAGRCVYRQDAKSFWDYHDFVFDNQDSMTPENLKNKVLEWAAAKGLDTLQLGQCIASRATEADIDRNIAEARSLGISQTPSIFINGRPLAGAIPWETLKFYIDTEARLRQKDRRGSRGVLLHQLARRSGQEIIARAFAWRHGELRERHYRSRGFQHGLPYGKLPSTDGRMAYFLRGDICTCFPATITEKSGALEVPSTRM